MKWQKKTFTIFLDTHSPCRLHTYLSRVLSVICKFIVSNRIYITVVEWTIFVHREIIRTYCHRGKAVPVIRQGACHMSVSGMAMQQFHEAAADISSSCMLHASCMRMLLLHACCFEAAARCLRCGEMDIFALRPCDEKNRTDPDESQLYIYIYSHPKKKESNRPLRSKTRPLHKKADLEILS